MGSISSIGCSSDSVPGPRTPYATDVAIIKKKKRKKERKERGREGEKEGRKEGRKGKKEQLGD